jgi:hypothetical protein
LHRVLQKEFHRSKLISKLNLALGKKNRLPFSPGVWVLEKQVAVDGAGRKL